MPGITPYQDPAFGERPSYGSKDAEDTSTDGWEFEPSTQRQQDAVMTDAYDYEGTLNNGEDADTSTSLDHVDVDDEDHDDE